MSDEVFEMKQFTCPKCGSHHFEQNTTTGGLCHGYNAKGQPCYFRFAFNDPAYFKGTGRFFPRTISARSAR